MAEYLCEEITQETHSVSAAVLIDMACLLIPFYTCAKLLHLRFRSILNIQLFSKMKVVDAYIKCEQWSLVLAAYNPQTVLSLACLLGFRTDNGTIFRYSASLMSH